MWVSERLAAMLCSTTCVLLTRKFHRMKGMIWRTRHGRLVGGLGNDGPHRACDGRYGRLVESGKGSRKGGLEHVAPLRLKIGGE